MRNERDEKKNRLELTKRNNFNELKESRNTHTKIVL